MATKKQKRKHSSYQHSSGVRPFWSGTISFGLVSVPVNLFPAQRHVQSGLRMLAPDGTPVARRYYCPQDDKDVPAEHLVRGYRVGDDEYVLIEDEELESLQPRKSRDIDLQRFVKRSELPPLFFERAYFLTPSGDSNKAYRLLAMAMEKEDRAGIATFVMRGKEYLVAILAEHGILRAQTLRFEKEVRSPADVGLPKAEKADRQLVKQFTRTIADVSQRELPLEIMTNQHHQMLSDLVERKRKRSKNVVIQQGEPALDDGSDGESVDLLESIRRQLSQTNGSSADNGASAKRKTSANGQLRDMSKQDLYEQAQQLDIAGRSKMSKLQLIKAIEKQ
jgi:DNA end-binding protein Ku